MARSFRKGAAGSCRRVAPGGNAVGAKRQPKPCRVCEHPERYKIDEGLSAGLSPRWMARRYSSDLNRVQLTKHRDRCLAATTEDAA